MPVKADREIRAAFEEFDKSRSGSITLSELGQLFDDMGLHCGERELKQCMARLDSNNNNQLEIVEFYQLWTVSRDDSGTPEAQVTNRLCELRKRLGERRNIFFGFNFDDWQSAVELDDTKVLLWSTRDVAKWIGFHGDLAPVRKYITRDHLKEVDGETLLELDPDYLVNQIGIKSIHVTKCMRVINYLREKNGLERRGTVGESGALDLSVQMDGGRGRGRSRSRSDSSTTSELAQYNINDNGNGNGDGSGAKNTKRKKTKKKKKTAKRPKQVGAWRRGELIGQGAFGKVYQGLELETGSLVAVKQIVVTMDADMREELQGEISVMSTLSHPNIVRYLGVQWDSPNQQLFIFTEWVPGGSLSDILKKFGKLTEGIVSRYTKQVLMGLEHLHTNGVIHLDIKPGNVLVDDRGNIKLADFGAARKLVGGQSVRAGGKEEEEARNNGQGGSGGGTVELLGTPYFMAPEMIKQTRHGRGADIWSLSGTVLMMFTGVPPWSQLNIKSTMALLFHISNADSPPPYPEELDNENLASARVVSGPVLFVFCLVFVRVLFSLLLIAVVFLFVDLPESHQKPLPNILYTPTGRARTLYICDENCVPFSTPALLETLTTGRAPPSCCNTRSFWPPLETTTGFCAKIRANRLPRTAMRPCPREGLLVGRMPPGRAVYWTASMNLVRGVWTAIIRTMRMRRRLAVHCRMTILSTAPARKCSAKRAWERPR